MSYVRRLRDIRGSSLILMLIVMGMLSLFVAGTASYFNSSSKSRTFDRATASRNNLDSEIRILASTPGAIRASHNRAKLTSGITEIEKCFGRANTKAPGLGPPCKLLSFGYDLTTMGPSTVVAANKMLEFNLYQPADATTTVAPRAGMYTTTSSTAARYNLRGDFCSQCDASAGTNNPCTVSTQAREECPILAETYMVVVPTNSTQNDCVSAECKFRIMYRIRKDPSIGALKLASDGVTSGTGVGNNSIGSIREITGVGDILSSCDINGVCPIPPPPPPVPVPPPPPPVATTCTDPTATNVGGPLPCTYPATNCTDPTATNFGSPLPCSYPPTQCNDPAATNFGGLLPCIYAPPPPPPPPPPPVSPPCPVNILTGKMECPNSFQYGGTWDWNPPNSLNPPFAWGGAVWTARNTITPSCTDPLYPNFIMTSPGTCSGFEEGTDPFTSAPLPTKVITGTGTCTVTSAPGGATCYCAVTVPGPDNTLGYTYFSGGSTGTPMNYVCSQ